MNQAILERIRKDNRNKEEALESEFYIGNLNMQFQDSDMDIIHNRLIRGKEPQLYTLVKNKEQRLVPFNTEIADLQREVGYLERIRCFLGDLFINLESVDRILRHTDKEIEDINERITILNYEKEQINGEV
ncbi:MAG: hypothetical protein AABY22_18190 [Nanoarchaeota archaeon]